MSNFSFMGPAPKSQTAERVARAREEYLDAVSAFGVFSGEAMAAHLALTEAKRPQATARPGFGRF